jgi:hypothetical protein
LHLQKATRRQVNETALGTDRYFPPT